MNLVRLLLDKTTGNIVAQESNLSPGTFDTIGYVYTQNIAATSWNIEHNGQTTALLVQIYDTSGEMVLPDKIDIVDANNVDVTFITPQTGKAFIILFSV